MWKAAIEADEVRGLLSVGYVADNDLIVPIQPPNGCASEIDLTKMRELNTHDVQLVKELTMLLDRLLELRA
jgi:hypothetical protein